jgi:3-hydroxyisobutyrate dehydrogenase
MTTQVGFIGLGTMGAGMAANIQRAGYELVVNDLREDAASPFLAAGATWADTPRAVAEACQIVLTSLPGPAEVRAVVLGPDGLLEGMAPGSAYLDLSTNSPTLIRELHATFAGRGVDVLDTPVSGGPAGAKSGKLAIWVGGDQAAFERHRHVLDALADQVFYVGPIGAGSVTKLVHNCAVYAVQTAMAEVFTLGVKAGVEPLALWQAVRQGALGRMRTFDRLPGQFLINKYDPPGFALRLAHKDVRLATELARELQVPMRSADLVYAELTEALNQGWGGRDSNVAMLLQVARAGVEIAVDPAEMRAALDA